MKLTPELKDEIDNKTYEQLLHRVRFGPIGDLMFQGESGQYWFDRMHELKNQPGGQERHVEASKSIGW